MNTTAIAFTAGVSLICSLGARAADEIADATVREMMGRVEAILTENGFNVQGFADRPAPIVEIADCTKHPSLKQCERVGAWQWKVRTIIISDREPEGCHTVTLAYELTRYAADLYGLTSDYAKTEPLGATGNRRIAQWETEVAKAVAAIVAQEPYRPNCLGRQAQRAQVVGTYRASFVE